MNSKLFEFQILILYFSTRRNAPPHQSILKISTESTLSRFLSITFLLLVLGFSVKFLNLRPSSLRDRIPARIRIPIDTWTAQGLETCDQTLIRWTTLDDSPDAGRGTLYRWSSSGWSWKVGESYSTLVWIRSLQRNRSGCILLWTWLLYLDYVCEDFRIRIFHIRIKFLFIFSFWQCLRDLKFPNISVLRLGVLKITDFYCSVFR